MSHCTGHQSHHRQRGEHEGVLAGLAVPLQHEHLHLGLEPRDLPHLRPHPRLLRRKLRPHPLLPRAQGGGGVLVIQELESEGSALTFTIYSEWKWQLIDSRVWCGGW